MSAGPAPADFRATVSPAWTDGRALVACVDTMVAGVHFPLDTTPADVARKLLAVNLSDLAAMGAEPLYALVTGAAGDGGDAWWEAFAGGLVGAAAEFRVDLEALERRPGDAVLTAELHGRVPPGEALRRAGARPGDRIYVTGTLGDAAAALAVLGGELAAPPQHARWLRARLDRPTPRLAAGRHLRGVASACIDVSDGLAADLGHVLEESGVGARLQVEQLPLSAALLATLPRERALALALAGGDDYELCFCAPASHDTRLAMRAPYLECGVRCIGVIEAEPGLRCVAADGTPVTPAAGWMHFR